MDPEDQDIFDLDKAQAERRAREANPDRFTVPPIVRAPTPTPAPATIPEPQPEVAGGVRRALEATAEDDTSAEGVINRLATLTGKPPAMLRALSKAEVARLAQEEGILSATQDAPKLRERYTDDDFARVAKDDAAALAEIERQMIAARGLAEKPATAQTLDEKFAVVFGKDFKPTMATVDPTMKGGLDILQGPTRSLASAVPRILKSFPDVGRWAADLADEVLRSPDSPALDVMFGATDKTLEEKEASGAYDKGKTKDPNAYLPRVSEWMKAGSDTLKSASETIAPEQTGNLVTDAINSGFQSAGNSVAWLASALITKNPSLALGGMSTQTAAASYGEYADAGRAPGEATLGAVAQGGIEALTEKLPFGMLVGDIAKKTPFGEMIFKQLVAEIPGEQVATLLQDAVDWAELNPDKTLQEFVAERPSAAAQTLIATVVATVTQTGLADIATTLQDSSAREAARAEREKAMSEGGLKTLDAVVAAAVESKTRELDPQQFEAFVDSLAQDAPVKAAYISAEAFAMIAASEAKSADQLAAEFGVEHQKAEALLSGTPIEIPLGKFASVVAGKESTREAYMRSVSWSPFMLSRDDMKLKLTEQTARLADEAQRLVDKVQSDSTFAAGVTEIYNTVKKQLDATRRFVGLPNEMYAKLTATGYGTLAQRLGITPQEAVARFPLKIAGESLTAEAAYTQEKASLLGPKNGEVTFREDGFKLLDADPNTRTADLQDQLGVSLRQASLIRKAWKEARGIPTHQGTSPRSAFKSTPEYYGQNTFAPMSESAANDLEGVDPAEWAGVIKATKYAAYRIPEGMEGAPLPKGYATVWHTSGAYAVSEKHIKEREKSGAATFERVGQETTAEDPNNPRRGFYVPSNATIHLLARADFSTYLHELGHHFLEMYTDIAAQLETRQLAGETLTQPERGIVGDFSNWLTDNGFKRDGSADAGGVATGYAQEKDWQARFFDNLLIDANESELKALRMRIAQLGMTPALRLFKTTNGRIVAFPHDYSHADARMLLAHMGKPGAEFKMLHATWDPSSSLKFQSWYDTTGTIDDDGSFAQIMPHTAVNAPIFRLPEAKDLDAQGVDPKDIWRRTGWAKTADGQWVWELGGEPRFKFNPERAMQAGLLDQMIDWPELFAAMPMLRNVYLFAGTGAQDGGFDSMQSLDMSDGTKKIAPVIRARGRVVNSNDLMETIRHEIQHAIQIYGGFASTGASSSDIAAYRGTERFEQAKARYRRMERELLAEQGLEPTDDNLSPEITVEAAAALEVYRQNYGEWQARQVEWRSRMSEDWKQNNPPGTDVPGTHELVDPNETWFTLEELQATRPGPSMDGPRPAARIADHLVTAASAVESRREQPRQPVQATDRDIERASKEMPPHHFEVYKGLVAGLSNQEIGDSLNEYTDNEDEFKTSQQLSTLVALVKKKAKAMGLAVPQDDARGGKITPQTMHVIALSARGVGPKEIAETVYGTADKAGQVRVLRNRHKATIEKMKAEREGGYGQNPVFYSALKRAVENSKQSKAPAAQWKATLKQTPGVKAEEIEWTGLFDALDSGWLTGASGFDVNDPAMPVSKAAIISYLNANGVEVSEVKRVAGSEFAAAYVEEHEDDSGETFWTVYHGGGDPARDFDNEADALKYRDEINREHEDATGTTYDSFTLPGGEDYTELLLTLPDIKGPSTHWDTPNVVAHVRFKTRYAPVPTTEQEEADNRAWNDAQPAIDAMRDEVRALSAQRNRELQDGGYAYDREPPATPSLAPLQAAVDKLRAAEAKLPKPIDRNRRQRVLAIEEVQSDWHQKGRTQGYAAEFDQAKLDEAQAKLDAVKAERRDAQEALRAAQKSLAEVLMSEPYVAIVEELDSPKRGVEPIITAADVIRDHLAQPTFGLVGTLLSGAVAKVRLTKAFKALPEAQQQALTAVSDAADAAEHASGEAALREREAGIARDLARNPAGTPDAPFKNNGWAALVLKRMVRWAAEHGFEQVAWIPGNIQNGSDVRESSDNRGAFYDKILVNEANKLGKKYGAQVAPMPISVTSASAAHRHAQQGYRAEPEIFHALSITPLLKEAALEGLPLFQPEQDGTPQEATAARAMREAPEGATPLQVWQSMSLTQRTPWHELFARQAEAYFFEGKAPSPTLRGMFQHFARWLRNVYKELRNINAPLTDEVRGVMDRMWASASDIAEAQNLHNMRPLFQTMPPGMDPNAWAEYQRLQANAVDEAEADLRQRSLRDMKWLGNARSKALRKLQAEAREQRKAVGAEVAAEVMAEPVNRAREFLSKGKNADGSKVADSVPAWIKREDGTRERVAGAPKISIAALKEMYPEASGVDFTRLGYGKYGMLAENGLHPDALADMFGYASGDALVRDLLDAEKASDKITGVTEQRMLERYGDLNNEAAVQRAADEAVYGGLRSRVLAAEYAALTAALGEKKLLNEAAKETAVKLVGRMNADKLSAAKFEAAARKAGAAAEAALRKDDIAQAAIAKRDQLLNHNIVREIYKQQKARDKAKALFIKIIRAKKENVAKARNYDLVQAARAILASVGMAQMRNEPMAYMDVVKRHDPRLYANLEPQILAALTTGKAVSQMSVDEFLTLRDTVEQLWNLAREDKQVEIDGQKLDLADVAGEINTRLDAMGADPHKIITENATTWQRTLRMGEGMAAALRRVEAWARYMDGLVVGPFTKYVFRPVSKAADRYRADRTRFIQAWRDLFKPIEAALTDARIDAREINYSFRGKAELLHAILHTGNKSNQRKLLLGRKWGTEDADGILDTTRWDAFISRMIHEGTLTAQDYDFVQGVWDLLEQTKPLAQETHRRVFGRYFNEITAEPVKTPFGEYRGGYVPAIYDDYFSTAVSMRNEQELLDASDSSMFPAPSKGFTEARVEYNDVLQLDLRLIASHIDRVLKFAHMAGPVRDVLRIINTKSVERNLASVHPESKTQMLIPWLVRSARQTTEFPMQGSAGRAVSGFVAALRRRSSMGLMFANLVNVLQQPTGLFNAAAFKGFHKRYMALALARYVRNPVELHAAVRQASSLMESRATDQAIAMRDTANQIIEAKGKFEKTAAWFERHTYFMQTALQNQQDVIVWLAAFESAKHDGANEMDARDFADGVIRQTQGSNNPEDVSRFETGTGWQKLLTAMYGYFNMWGNHLSTEFRGTVRELGLKKSAGRLVYVYVAGFMIPALLAQFIADAMRGDLPDDDDEPIEAWLLWFLGAQARTGAAMVPLGGPTVMASVNAFNEKPYDDRVLSSPAISALESVARVPVDIYDYATGNGDLSRTTKDSLGLITLLTGIPVQALGRPLGYLADIAEGDRSAPDDAVEAARGLVTGR